MSTEIIQSEANDAYLQKVKILQLKRSMGACIYELGKELYSVQQKYKANPQEASQLYGFENFNSFLAAPVDSGGVDFSRQSAYQFIRLYETYELKLACKAILLNVDYTKLDIIRDAVNENNVEQWIEKAKTLSRSDLREAIREGREKGEIPEPEAEVECLHTKWMRKCLGCEKIIYEDVLVDEKEV